MKGSHTQKKHKCVYLFEDGLSVFKSHAEENREVREKKTERKGHSVVTRGGISCSVLLF